MATTPDALITVFLNHVVPEPPEASLHLKIGSDETLMTLASPETPPPSSFALITLYGVPRTFRLYSGPTSSVSEQSTVYSGYTRAERWEDPFA